MEDTVIYILIVNKEYNICPARLSPKAIKSPYFENTFECLSHF